MTTPASTSLEHWAVERPHSVALIEDERTLTYAALNEAANRLATGLDARGIAMGDVIVVRTHIRLEWAVIAAALGKLGCYLLGLNWRLTPSEVQYVLHNSGASALICDDPNPEALLKATADLALKLYVSIDVPAAGFVTYSELLASGAKPRTAAQEPPLIIYTSGTTGLPKGVVMGRCSKFFTEEQLAEYQRDVRQARRSNAEHPVVLVTMPMHHGAGPAQLWGALRGGRTSVLLRRFDPERALQLIERHRVTDWNAVPTMLKRIAALPRETLAKYDVSSIQHLSVGAAPVPYSLKEWVLSYFGEHCLSEGYGSTETGMVTHLPPKMQRKKPGSSGRPYVHVSIEVRDAQGRVLPPMHTGELWIRTPTTIGRYLNSGELDRDTLDERGFFRSGDIGYLDDEGYLYITDRAKDLIISGGVNIYPAEIEAAILRHPAIQDAAVIGVPDEEFGERVQAVCELKPGHTVTREALQGFLADQLASYKRPKHIEFVAELPRNTMGKVLKRELRAPYWRGRERNV